jgi:hydroxypyruvate isomerase
MLNVNSPPGPGGEPGLATAAGREREFDALCAKALDYVTAIGGTSVHLLAGIVPPNERPAAETRVVANLRRAADAAAAKNIFLLLEPLKPARPAGLFLLAHRAHRRRDRQGRPAEREDHVRLLSCAGDAGRRAQAHGGALCR